MSCVDCACGKSCERGGPADGARDRSPATSALPRRQMVLGGIAAMAAMVFGRLPGDGTAWAGTVDRTFKRPAGSRKVGNIKSLAAGAGLATIDPSTGRAAWIIRLTSARKVVAYSAICTHSGCKVAYVPSAKLIECPCHHSVYDPAHGAAVVAGPAPYPLPALKVKVDSKGNIWLV